jgi:hypothetical protein
MNSKSRFAQLCLLTLGLALAAAPASADTTYVYTGNDYTSAYGLFTTSMNLTGSFTVASPLIGGLSDVDISSEIISWEFNDGVDTYGSTDPFSGLTTAQVSTGPTGAIDGWDFAVGSLFFVLYADAQSDSASGDSANDGAFIFPLGEASNSDPGTWVEVAATPEPPSGLYLATGLLVLGTLVIGKRRLRPQLA